MPGKERTMIEKGERLIRFKHNGGGEGAGDDLAEEAAGHDIDYEGAA